MNRPNHDTDEQYESELNDRPGDVPDTTHVSRRSVLRTGAIVSSSALLGGAALPGSVAGRPENLVSKVASHGHYSWFPLGPASWGRSSNPVDIKQDEKRWMTKPAARGGVQCRIENLPTPFRNAGFDVHLGALGRIETVTIQAKTNETNLTGGSAWLVAALYFDVNDNSEFFAWKDARGNTEAWDGFGGDTERGLAAPASGSITIDTDTEFPVFAGSTPPTLGDLQAGEAIDGVDGSTDTALYIGVASQGGEAAGTEDITIESVTVKRN